MLPGMLAEQRQPNNQKKVAVMNEKKCRRCGLCCQAIPMPQGFEAMKVEEVYQGERFKEHWRRITVEEAQAINTGLTDCDCSKHEFFTCDLYDAENHACIIQESKPYVCSGFPYYGGTDPVYANRLPPGCGFAVHAFELDPTFVETGEDAQVEVTMRFEDFKEEERGSEK